MVRLLKVEGCIGCQACANICPSELMIWEQGESHLIVRFPPFCAEDCRLCQDLCPAGAISLEEVAGSAVEGGGTVDVLLELSLC
ncbi:MAG: 4Fe-4S dicluster domain-containing protein, partial [Methanosarcinales archaeon]|nr:4Fe-4S dicluster domain-containing protein [Methanosarcinales archaeon]